MNQSRIGARSWATPHGLIARVTINDHAMATLRTPAGGLNPAMRAVRVKLRLGSLLSAGLTQTEISVVPIVSQGWEIRGRGQPILLVTSRDAAGQKQSTRRLAFSWAQNCRHFLAEPWLTLSARQVLVPYGATRIIQVGGAARACDITLASGNRTVSHASYSPATRCITLTGCDAGQSQWQVHAGTSSLPVGVTVKRYAALVQSRVTVRVTGTPFAPASLVQNAVYLGLKHAMTAEGGAQMRLLHAPSAVSILRPGGSVMRRIAIHVAGPNLIPVEAAPLITVVNQPLPAARAEKIFYSNNPEQVRESRTLFTGPLAPFETIRLDYHHQNHAPLPLIFHADVVNSSSQHAAVHCIGGVAEPEVDTVQIGRRAGALFLQSLDNGIGYVVDIPPHGRVPLVVQRFAPGLTVSGILQVEQVSGLDKALSLTVVADGDKQALVSSPSHLALAEADTAGGGLAAIPAALEETDTIGAASPYVFGPPLVSLTNSYAAGGKWGYVHLGNQESLRNAAGTQTLWGNYGVSYFVTLNLSNPTNVPHDIGVFFAPEAGLAAGVFQVRGERLLQFDPMAPPEEKELTRVHLLAGQSRIMLVRTILLNGSAYPASLVIHAF